jgi:hypothetical protein
VILLNTHPHTQHYYAWCVDIYINGGWPDSENLITGGPTDRRETSIPSQNWVLGLTQPYKIGL